MKKRGIKNMWICSDCGKELVSKHKILEVIELWDKEHGTFALDAWIQEKFNERKQILYKMLLDSFDKEL